MGALGGSGCASSEGARGNWRASGQGVVQARSVGALAALLCAEGARCSDLPHPFAPRAPVVSTRRTLLRGMRPVLWVRWAGAGAAFEVGRGNGCARGLCVVPGMLRRRTHCTPLRRGRPLFSLAAPLCAEGTRCYGCAGLERVRRGNRCGWVGGGSGCGVRGGLGGTGAGLGVAAPRGEAQSGVPGNFFKKFVP